MLAQRQDWEICAEATNGVEAVRRAQELHPHLAILDISMPKMDGVEAARQILATCQGTAVVLISLYDATLILSELEEIGVGAFVAKSSLGADLIPAVEALLEGKTRAASAP